MPYTHDGQDAALYGAGLRNVVTHLRLYDTTSTPAEDGTGFVECSGGGYAAKAISAPNWTAVTVSTHRGIRLADQVFTASGGAIANIAGLYITDTGGNVLGWVARTAPLTLADGESLTIDDATFRFATAG